MEIWQNLNEEDLDGEIWKDIEGFKNIYQVSNLGRIKSLNREVECNANRYRKSTFKKVKGRILKQKLNKYGYLVVVLQNKSKKLHKSAHRLVLENFNPIKNMDTLTVNHKTGIKTLNLLSNLEWATQKEQYDHAVKTGLINENTIPRGENVGVSKLNSKQVKEIYENKNNLTYNELSKKYNITKSDIGHIMNDITWKHITHNLVKNKILKRLEYFDVIFIFTNPSNFTNQEMCLLFNKNSNAIRRIYKRERHKEITINYTPNEINYTGKNFYKATLDRSDVFYFTNIDKFVNSQESISRFHVMKGLKNGTIYNNFKFEICGKDEYRNYLFEKYKKYKNTLDKSN